MSATSGIEVNLAFNIATEELDDGGWRAIVVGQPLVEQGETEVDAVRRVLVLAMLMIGERFRAAPDERIAALIPKEPKRPSLIVVAS